MPRPALNKKRFPASLPAELLDRLDAIAAAAGKTRADAVADAVREWVRAREAERPVPPARTKGVAARKTRAAG